METNELFLSSSLRGKEPSDILSIEEFKKIASFIPPEKLFDTLSFQYYHQQNAYILPGANLYIKAMRRLDNDIQRYLLFLWSIGVQILVWNNSLINHECAPELRWISDDDWEKADNEILSLAMSGAF